MSTQDNIPVARAFVEGINAHSLAQMAQCLDSEVKVEVATGAECPLFYDQFLSYNENYLRAFPDVHFDVTVTIADGDYVVLHWDASGTQTETLKTSKGGIIVPTGKRASASGVFTFEIRNQKIVRAWVIWDMAKLLAQLGLLSTI